ncbi:MAG: hypothetical protein LAO55_01370 [Acidobacteriia bacterium]|nr:hypothetical protein [Terriglobia bacterium]
MASRRRTIVFILSAAAGLTAVYFTPKPFLEISRQELIAEVQSGYVHEVTIVDGEVATGVSTRRGKFRVVLRRGDRSLADELSKMGVEVKFETTPLGLI